MIYGVDVASYEGYPNWSQVHASGISFGFSKVTQGTGYLNPTWAHNRAGMLGLGGGFVPGAYHFLEDGDAAGQVAYFLANAGDVSQMAVALDVEPATSSPSVATAHAWVTEFHRQRPGHPVLCYFPEWYWQQLGDPDISFADPVWQSRYVSGSGSPAGLYGRVPGSWWSGFGGAQVAMLQFSSSGAVSGISGQVDVSAFQGTVAELRALALGGSAPSPQSQQEDDDMRGNLDKGHGAVTALSWPQGTAKAIGFFADTGLLTSGPLELRVAFNMAPDASGNVAYDVQKVTLDSGKRKAVVSFGAHAGDVAMVSVERLNGTGDESIAWDAS